MTNKKLTGASGRRRSLRREYWKNDDAWTGDNEKGWFRAPRTLPLVLGLLGQKDLSGALDPTKVYLELLARHIDNGIVEMSGVHPLPLTPPPPHVLKGHRRKVDLQALLTGIVVSPWASATTLDEVNELISSKGYSIPVRQSELSRYLALLPDR